MLSVGGSSAAGESTGPDFVAIYQEGGFAKRSEAAVTEAVEAGLAGPAPTPPGGAAAAGTEYAAPRMRQLKLLMWRQALRYWRLPEYNAIRMLVTLTFALVIGSLYWDKGQVFDCSPLPAQGGRSVGRHACCIRLNPALSPFRQVAPGSDTTSVMAVLNILFMSLSNLGAINLNAVVVVAAQVSAAAAALAFWMPVWRLQVWPQNRVFRSGRCCTERGPAECTPRRPTSMPALW
jgi:hypothetical protein